VSDAERFDRRIADKLYSEWHRVEKIRRFVGPADADALGMINIDALLRCERWAEYCRGCSKTAALIETALDNGQTHKEAYVTAGLANDAGVEAYAVLITPNAERDDIEQFRIRRVAPDLSKWQTWTPQQFADFLVRIRARAPHRPGCRQALGKAA